MSSRHRLEYVDWTRGLAVLLMMQAHVYEAWLTSEAKATRLYAWSRLLGGYPAPLFLFLAGLSLALMAARAPVHPAGRGGFRPGVRRGLEIFGYALLFRLWMWTTGGFASPRDLLRVDVLNCIGLSMVLVSAVVLRGSLRRRIARAAAVAAAVALLTPLAWDAAWPGWIPRPLLGYVSGRVEGALFPIFPWTGFCAAGAGVGTALALARARGGEAVVMALLAAAGAAALPLAAALDRLPQVYPRYDFWWTSPNYFLMKCGIVLLTLAAVHAWCAGPWAALHGPLRQLGRTSLLVYWVHIEIVYGGLVAPWVRGRLDARGASISLGLLALAMLALSLARTRLARPPAPQPG